MSGVDFQLVRKKKRSKQRSFDSKIAYIQNLNRSLTVCSNDVGLVARVTEICNDLKTGTFYMSSVEKLKNSLRYLSSSGRHHRTGIEEIVCYGLGNFADCYIARYQLAFLQALRQELQVSTIEQCSIYDPKFTAQEKGVLHKLGYQVLDTNEEGKRRIEGHMTLFYMPHCGKALYNNLLWTNWSEENLTNVIIIGNSFKRMVEMTPNRILEKTGSYILKVQPYSQEAELSPTDDLLDVFNDTAILTFPMENVQEVSEAFWEDRLEPIYDDEDAEIISDKDVKR